jgi:hypothetical protein
VTKVDITTAGHTVIVEIDGGNLDEVAAKALELWKATRDPRLDKAYSPSGFQMERSNPDYISGYDAE